MARQEWPRRNAQGTTKAIKENDGEGDDVRGETWTYDWRHKGSFNNADHRPLLVGSRFECNRNEDSASPSPDARMPSCPPLHIANPNAPQSLDDASVAPSRSYGGRRFRALRRRGVLVVHVHMKPVHCNVVVDPWGSLIPREPERGGHREGVWAVAAKKC